MSVTSVSRVTFDGNQYQQLGYDLADPTLDLYRFNGTSRLETWTPQPVYVHHPRLRRPDIWHLAGAAALVFEDSTVPELEPYVSAAGELLELIYRDHSDRLLLLNITQDVDCLDVAASSLGPVNWRLSFLEHRMPESGLFKIPQADAVHVLCLEHEDEADSFRKRVASLELTGLDFEPVWSSSDGPREFSLMRV
jgi:hypothetical protein